MQKVVPAILTKDPSLLKDQLKVLQDHTKWVHIDIMDGRFVSNVSVNISQLQDAYQFFNLELHLMVKDPENYLEDCNAVGAKRVYFHLEGTENPKQVLSLMEKYPFQRGIALNPEISVEKLASVGKNTDAVLLLSVVPGAQGNEFIPEVAEKISDIKALNKKLLIGLDGGVGESNIQDIFLKGADYVVSGSAIWKAQDSMEAFRKLEGMVS